MNRTLLETLVHTSAELQKAHAVARTEGREDIAQCLRKAAWDVANAISVLVPDRSAEVEAS